MRVWTTRFLGIVVWTWALWSLYNVARWGGAVLFDPSTTSRIMAVRSGERIDSAIGLTYSGIGGAALVVAELAVVITALVFSLATPAWKRRVGSIVIVLWSLLWTANSVWMQTLSGWGHASNTTLLLAIHAVVITWAALRWRVEQ